MYSVIYEDANILIVNKESGVLVHKTKHDNTPNNLIDSINCERGMHYLVHRIDKFTSGSLILVKNRQSLAKFQNLFSSGQIEKKYLTILSKSLPAKRVKINLSLGRSNNSKLMFSNKNARNYKKSCTEVKILEKNLVEVILKTGRTHQIRAHLREIGCPILNDPIYGKECFDSEFGQYLHSYSLNFICPITNKHIFVFSPLPDKFLNKLSELNIDIEKCQLER